MPETYRSQHAGSIADLIRQRGQVDARAAAATGNAEAQARMAAGQAWGNAIQNIGQTVSGTLGDYAKYREDAPNRQLRQRQSDLLAEQLSQLETTAAQAKIGELAQMVKASGYDPSAAEPVFQAIATLSPEYAEPLQRALMEPQMLRSVTDTLITQTPGYKAPEGFNLSEGQTRFGPDGKPVASVPKSAPPVAPPQPFTLTPGSKRFNPDGTLSAEVPAATPQAPNPTEASLAMMAAQGNEPAARALAKLQALRSQGGGSEPLVPIVGPDGKTRYGTRQEARGSLVPSGSEKPSSGVQKRVLAFFNRAQQADKDIEGMEANIQALDLGGQTWLKYAPNFAQTALGQQYTQAQRAFTEARLRKDSGAAIPSHEYTADRETYFAEPGDDPETLENKRRGRAAILASLAFESGQALGEFLGDSEEASRVVKEFRTRAETKGALKVRMRAPDGSTQDVDPSMVEHYKSKGATVVK